MNLKGVKQLIKSNKGKFYVYLMRRPKGTPFYGRKSDRTGILSNLTNRGDGGNEEKNIGNP